MLHIGVDEAGYGPLLGPLVVGVAVLRLIGEAARESVDLRRRLSGLIVRRPRDARRSLSRPLPVPVDDSKVIHRRFGLPGLARGFGVFASAMDTPPPADLSDLLTRFSDHLPSEFGRPPWYRDLAEAAVPRYPWTGPLEEKFRRRHVQALDLRVLSLCAGDYNEQIHRYGNKAHVLGLASATGLLSVLDLYPEEDADIVFDRQGGRLDYASYLADLFPFAVVTQRPSAAGEAHYEVVLPGRRLHVRFLTGGDRLSLAVSWASMAAKLTRELFMQRLNAWFLMHLPGLRRTAGYTVDGRRFLAEVKPVLRRKGIDESLLVRIR